MHSRTGSRAGILAGMGVVAALGSPPASSQSASLEEVIVTAQKREESLQEVPTSISVLSGSALEQFAPSSLADFASLVPGFAVQSGGSPGQTRVVLRGIATGNNSLIGGSNLVSTYIDDSPLGSSSRFAAAGAASLDLMPYDIERVEVLRGPQGTLYGASAMGGLLKYVLRAPDLHEFEGRAGADLQQTDGSGDISWGVRSAVNLPLVEGALGMRASGFRNDVAGYIDNVGLGIKDENGFTQDGGRLAVLWQPTDALSIKATALLQNVDSNGNAAVSIDNATRQPVYGEYRRATLTPESFEQRLEYYALTADWELGAATATSASSWSRSRNRAEQDLSGVFAQFIPLISGGGVTSGATPFQLRTKVSKFTQELRLTSSDEQRVQWMIGGFYTEEDALNRQDLGALTLDGDAIAGVDPMLLVHWPTTYRETAGFGTITYEFTDRFDVTGGLRYASNSQRYHQTLSGPLAGGAAPVNASADESVTTWMTSARLRFSDATMFYARAATGYRPGGPNIAILNVPPSFAADELTNYEIGVKSELLAGTMQLEVSAFYIDWQDIQLDLLSPQGLTYPGNGSGAVSQGGEVTTTYRVTDSLRLRASLAYTDAHLTEDAPTLSGEKGAQLPMSPRWNGSLSLDYLHPLDDARTLEFGGAYRYVGEVYNALESAPNPQKMEPQNVVDLYAGLAVGAVTGRLFLKNALNDDSYSSLLNNYHPVDSQFVPILPRTVGLSVEVQF